VGDVGVAADPKAGLQWLTRAMKQNIQAQVALQAAVLMGQVLEQGTVSGVPKNIRAALVAFGRASQLDPNNLQLRAHYEELDRLVEMERKRTR
jgi:TPR repeat protein